MLRTHNSEIVAEVCARFGVGPQYAQAYLDYWCQSRNQIYPNLEAILTLPDPEPMWFEYALSTNWRGEQMLNLLRPYLRSNMHRYLDVGCGFGGFLAAFARYGFEVCGIEIDTQRIALADANLADWGLANRVNRLSILDEGLSQRLGTFDVITCIDVIEHVLDVPKALRHMVSLLNPGGFLILEIPNRHDLRFVARDGHFGLFGITLLERKDALRYHQRFFAFEYDVGEYFSSNYYRQKLEEAGCECRFLDSSLHVPASLRQMPALTRETLRRFAAFVRNQRQQVPFPISLKIQVNYARYLLKLAISTVKLAFASRYRDLFKTEYLTDFWTLMASRQAE
jgi:SAM-dependent methyltransferase